MKFMTVCVRFSEFVKDSEDSENSNLFVFVHIKFEMFEFVWEGKIWRMTPLMPSHHSGHFDVSNPPRHRLVLSKQLQSQRPPTPIPPLLEALI